MKLIYIEWLDAVSQDEWTSLEELDLPPSKILTVGLLVKETKTHLTVSLNHDTVSDSVSCTITIPKAWVQKRRYLR